MNPGHPEHKRRDLVADLKQSREDNDLETNRATVRVAAVFKNSRVPHNTRPSTPATVHGLESLIGEDTEVVEPITAAAITGNCERRRANR